MRSSAKTEKSSLILPPIGDCTKTRIALPDLSPSLLAALGIPSVPAPIGRCRTAGPHPGGRWPARLVATACPSYFYVNARRARYDYLLRQGTWNMMFGPGKTATSILNEAAARRNEEFNNVVGAAKGAWCESVKAFGIKHFDWGPLFEVD